MKETCKLTVVFVLVDEVLSSTIPIVVMNGSTRAVDGQLLKVGASMSVELSVEVREDTALQQRVFSEVDAADNVSRLKHDLLCLCEVVGRVGVQLHDAEGLQRSILLRDNLSGV